MGNKGRVKVNFGEEILSPMFASPEELAAEIDRQIVAGYACFPINYAAHKLLAELGECQALDEYGDIETGVIELNERGEGETETVKLQLYSMYAQPIIRKQNNKHE
jgi:hypothetical protein